jgi:ppGpp synthetase/RelA/SpoT-type nucleotidyltranferase
MAQSSGSLPPGSFPESTFTSDPALLALHYTANTAREVARRVQSKIFRALDGNTDLERLTYSITSRVKNEYRIVEKVRAQRSSGFPEFQPWSLSDICGFRIITLFQSSIVECLAYLVGLVRQPTAAGTSPFVANEIRDILLYTSRPSGDPLSIKGLLEKFKRDTDLNFREFETSDMYSSVHLVAQCDVEMEDESRPNSTKKSRLNVEFQIRSVFEEAWGQISQKVWYSQARGVPHSEIWHNHVNALKVFVDGCIQYSQIIKDHYDDAAARQLSGIKTENRAIEESSDEILRGFFNAVPINLYRLLEEGFKLADNAKIARDAVSEHENYRKSAERFLTAYESLGSYQISNPNIVAAFGYRTRMEYAWSLYNANNRDDSNLQKASNVYLDIEKEYPYDATSRYRHAIVLSAKQEGNQAEILLREAIQILDSNLDSSIPSDHWLHASVRRALGFIYWYAARDNREGQHDRQREYMQKAVSITREGRERTQTPDQRFIFMNNLLYYGWFERDQLLEAVDPAAAGNWIVPDEEYKELLGAVIAYVGPPEGDVENRLSALDTICRTLAFEGDDREASNFAVRIISLLSRKVIRLCGAETAEERVKARLLTQEKILRQHLPPIEYETFIYASSVLARANTRGSGQ